MVVIVVGASGGDAGVVRGSGGLLFGLARRYGTIVIAVVIVVIDFLMLVFVLVPLTDPSTPSFPSTHVGDTNARTSETISTRPTNATSCDHVLLLCHARHHSHRLIVTTT